MNPLNSAKHFFAQQESGPMTEERYNLLMREHDVKLTLKEFNEGWHFCPEMDGLLANYNEPDGDCFCELNKCRTKKQNNSNTS